MPIKRQYPEAPIIGIGAIVFNEGGQVLLAQRGKPPRVGQWSIPGGMLELGEKLTEGLQREVQEECGIEIKVGEVVLIYEPIIRDDEGRIEFHYVLVDYWAHHVSGEAIANDDALAVAWVALDDLSSYRLASDTVDAVRKAWSMWKASKG